jgi:two-component system, LuxR family, response regulator FixJ
MSTVSCLRGPIDGALTSVNIQPLFGRALTFGCAYEPERHPGDGERSMAAEPTIHIVDDDARVRRSLELLLHAAGFATIIQYGTPSAFLDPAPELSGGCVLLHVSMPEVDGLQILARMHELRVHMPVIIMVDHGDIQTAVRAIKAGASDFIEKPFDDGRLITAIEAALAGSDRYESIGEAASRIATLSRRQREVLDGLVAGQQNKAIAADLGISARTVEVYRAQMLERLGTRRLADAIRLGVLASLGSIRG